MPRQVDKEPVQKHTLNLYEGDFQRLQDMFPEIGASLVIRKIIRKYLTDASPKGSMPVPKEEITL